MGCVFRVTFLALLLGLALPASAKDKPLVPPGERVPLLVEDPLAGVEGMAPGVFYYQQSVGLALGTAFALADQARADDAAALIAPLFEGLNLANDVTVQLERALDRDVFGADFVVTRYPKPIDDLKKLDVDHPVLVTKVGLASRDFSRLFVSLSIEYFDPANYSRWRSPRRRDVTYEVRFPEIVPTEKRLENAKRLAALGPERVQGAVRAAIPELVEMMNYEARSHERKERKLGYRRVPIPFGGTQGMKIVREHGDRLWLRWGTLGTSIGLYSAPAARDRAPERKPQLRRGQTPPPKGDE